MYCKHSELWTPKWYEDCLTVSFDFNPPNDIATLIVARRDGDNIKIINELRNEDALEIYDKLIYGYSVWTDKWDYDEFNGFVVVAKDEDNALEMVVGLFNEWQLDSVHVEEVDLTTEHVVLESFNAG